MSFDTLWQHLLSLVWVNAGQSTQQSIPVDATTYQFFTPNSSPAAPISQPLQRVEESSQELSCSQKPSTQERAPSKHPHSTKFMPHPVEIAATETNATKKTLQSISTLTFSDYHDYDEPKKEKKWLFFSLLSENPEYKNFFDSIKEAIKNRLHIAVETHILDSSSELSTISITSQIAAMEHDLILFCITPHVETSLLNQLQTNPDFIHVAHQNEPPLITIGTIYHKPIRILVFTPPLLENKKTKALLWHSLQKLGVG